jgi:hypothetical protein
LMSSTRWAGSSRDRGSPSDSPWYAASYARQAKPAWVSTRA